MFIWQTFTIPSLNIVAFTQNKDIIFQLFISVLFTDTPQSENVWTPKQLTQLKTRCRWWGGGRYDFWSEDGGGGQV